MCAYCPRAASPHGTALLVTRPCALLVTCSMGTVATLRVRMLSRASAGPQRRTDHRSRSRRRRRAVSSSGGDDEAHSSQQHCVTRPCALLVTCSMCTVSHTLCVHAVPGSFASRDGTVNHTSVYTVLEVHDRHLVHTGLARRQRRWTQSPHAAVRVFPFRLDQPPCAPRCA